MKKRINAKVHVEDLGQKSISFIYDSEPPLSKEEQIYSNLGMVVFSTEEDVRKVYVLRTIGGQYVGKNSTYLILFPMK